MHAVQSRAYSPYTSSYSFGNADGIENKTRISQKYTKLFQNKQLIVAGYFCLSQMNISSVTEGLQF